MTKEAFAEELGSEPHVGAIHAGLECGLLGEKFPGMDMVRPKARVLQTFLTNFHSPRRSLPRMIQLAVR